MASKQRKKPTKRSSRARSSLMMSPYAQLIIGVALIAFALYFVIIIHKGAAIHTSQISSEMGFGRRDPVQGHPHARRPV